MKQYKIKVNGNPYDVTVHSIDENGVAKVTVNGKEHTVEVEIDKKVPSGATPASVPVQTAVREAPSPAAVSSSEGIVVTTPLPGVILSVKVNVGDKVAVGQTLSVLEAMKMENSIESEVDGVVTAIHVQRGDSVLEGAKIVTISR